MVLQRTDQGPGEDRARSCRGQTKVLQSKVLQRTEQGSEEDRARSCRGQSKVLQSKVLQRAEQGPAEDRARSFQQRAQQGLAEDRAGACVLLFWGQFSQSRHSLRVLKAKQTLTRVHRLALESV